VLDKSEHCLEPALVLQINNDGSPAAAQHLLTRVPSGDRTLDSDHISAKVGQHHRAERSWTNAGEFDDAEASERAVMDHCGHLQLKRTRAALSGTRLAESAGVLAGRLFVFSDTICIAQDAASSQKNMVPFAVAAARFAIYDAWAEQEMWTA
jgi:hypothetical protein